MMANQWFRLYSEFATDPKVQILDETFQRRYIMFLCVTCNGDVEKRTDKELAFLFRISLEDFQTTRKILIESDLLDENGFIKNWDKRQYVSDISTERVKKHRMKQSETLHETLHTVSETPPDTDTDTDTEKKEPLSTDVDPPLIGERTDDRIKVPYDLILSAYNKFCPSMPRVKDLTDKRRTAIRLRHLKYLKHPTGPLEVIDTVFKKAEASDFLSGRDGKWTNCNFDWLMNENNMVKVIEGNYDNKDIPPKMTASKGVNRLLDRIQQMQEAEDAQT